jgi:hypothetical protein
VLVPEIAEGLLVQISQWVAAPLLKIIWRF